MLSVLLGVSFALTTGQLGFLSSISNSNSINISNNSYVNLKQLTLSVGTYIITYTIDLHPISGTTSVSTISFGLGSTVSELGTNGGSGEALHSSQMNFNLTNYLYLSGTFIGQYNTFNGNTFYLNIIANYSGPTLVVTYSSIRAIRIA